MINRQTGFCSNCNSNVVHVRVFQRRMAYVLDRLTLSFFGWLGLGPWQCVDCGDRNMTLLPVHRSARNIAEESDTLDLAQSVGNFIRTDQSLAHAVSDESRFSRKYRSGIVEKLLEGKSTVTRTCQELGVSELVVQRWLRDYMQEQLDRVAKQAQGSLILANSAGSPADDQLDCATDEVAGLVIDSSAIPKPR